MKTLSVSCNGLNKRLKIEIGRARLNVGHKWHESTQVHGNISTTSLFRVAWFIGATKHNAIQRKNRAGDRFFFLPFLPFPNSVFSPRSASCFALNTLVFFLSYSPPLSPRCLRSAHIRAACSRAAAPPGRPAHIPGFKVEWRFDPRSTKSRLQIKCRLK